ncbi:MAG: roadblock/LC7 domain-containing protein [Deltaproteobacteria bacterium]|nr:roadblock/LC7 domain-containing protein [Deltaproteobacteria bacterium]
MNHNHETTMKTRELITKLVRDSEALTILLITKEGQVMSEAGDVSSLNTTAMAALVAGMFSATREVARMVGENQFSILLQQGEKRHIHISLVTDSAMMVIVFEDYQRIGRVRHEARKTGEKLIEVLTKQKKTTRENEDLSVPEFKEYALNLIDQIFQSKP